MIHKINMREFGIVLMGREYGLNAAKKILSESPQPFEFDFTGVVTMGSSFGDEIFKSALKAGLAPIVVRHANKVVRSALNQIQADLNTQFEFPVD